MFTMGIPLQVSLALRYLHQREGVRLKDLQEAYPQYKKTTIYRHMKKPVNETEVRKEKPKGRTRKVTERDTRHILAAVRTLYESHGNFSGRDIQNEAGVMHLSLRTVRRVLNEQGYRYRQCRKKGILLKEDLVKRYNFAKKCKRLDGNFWKSGVSFYLDGVSFVHKTNPTVSARTSRTRTWMRKGDSLARHCTAKGKKEGVQGRTASFMCAISYNRGFIGCHQYRGPVNGDTCRDFIETRFPEMFEASSNSKGKLFLQDGCPSQNSAVAKEAMDSVGCRLFKIPARSPDLNPIENVFHNIRKKLSKDALEQKIEKETYEEFCRRVRKTILEYSSTIIDRTIDSMPKRIDMVLKNKGLRTKY